MHFFMASFTGFERLYSLLVGRGAPGSKSMAQLYVVEVKEHDLYRRHPALVFPRNIC